MAKLTHLYVSLPEEPAGKGVEGKEGEDGMGEGGNENVKFA